MSDETQTATGKTERERVIAQLCNSYTTREVIAEAAYDAGRAAAIEEAARLAGDIWGFADVAAAIRKMGEK